MKKTGFAFLVVLMLLISITGGVAANYVTAISVNCDGVSLDLAPDPTNPGTADLNGGTAEFYFYQGDYNNGGTFIGTTSIPLTVTAGVPGVATATAFSSYPAGLDISVPFSVGVKIWSAVAGIRITGLAPQLFDGLPCTPPPPPPGAEGCTPGYWKNHTNNWTSYTPASDYEVVFSVNASFRQNDFNFVINQGGGGEIALGRHAVAALLNAASGGVDSPYGPAAVITMVQNAYATGDFEGVKNTLAAANELGCPLGE